MAQNPLSSVDEAHQQVVNTERLRLKGGKEKESVMAFKVEAKHRVSSRDTNENFFAYYNRMGHDEESCYQLISFPEWWNEKKRGGRGPGRGGRTAGDKTGRGGRGSRSSTVTIQANAVQRSSTFV